MICENYILLITILRVMIENLLFGIYRVDFWW